MERHQDKQTYLNNIKTIRKICFKICYIEFTTFDSNSNYMIKIKPIKDQTNNELSYSHFSKDFSLERKKYINNYQY